MSDAGTIPQLWAAPNDKAQPVYEKNDQAILGQQLVMTPWMLLDRLKDYQDATRQLRQSIHVGDGGTVRVECPGRFVHRLERLQCDVEQALYLLWRGGLWVESEIEERTAVDGRGYLVVREPFTDDPTPAAPNRTPIQRLKLAGFD